MARSETPIEEIESWARRMIDEVSGFDYAGSALKWRNFCMNVLLESGREISADGLKSQLDTLEMGRLPLVEFQEELGFAAYTDKRGQFHFTDTSGELQKRGTFVSRSNLNQRIYDEKLARGDIKEYE